MSILFALLLFSGCNKSAVGPVLPAAVEEARVPRAADPTEAKVITGDGYQAVKIPKATFMMGAEDNKAFYNEKPAHEVTITYDFYMMTTEVTQDLYEKVTGSNPSWFKGSSRPVEYVTWTDAVRFANELSRKEGLEECYAISESGVSWPKKLDCLGWRLPTEAEWEYTANANQGFKYAGSDNIDEVAWYEENSNDETHSVGQKKANGFRLFDMSGNVFEWCWDWHDDEYYSSSPTEDPTGPTTGTFRVLRGGSWRRDAGYAGLSVRSWYYPSGRINHRGIRLSRTIP